MTARRDGQFFYWAGGMERERLVVVRKAKCNFCGKRRIVVRTFMGNYSAFNGYHFTASDYSEVVCVDCLTSWRTKAKYVGTLPRIPENLHGVSQSELQEWFESREG